MYIFNDLDGEFNDAIKALRPDAACVTGPVETIQWPHGTVFISPANSFGFMDGGIDLAYSRVMFPGIEARVKRRIKDRGDVTSLGRPFLPIGTAIATKASEELEQWLITAPTMLLPQDVSMTRNVYYATLAALPIARSTRELRTIVIPAMGTGYGKVSPADAAKQVHDAIETFEAGAIELPSAQTIAQEQPSSQKIMDEQPDTYENREIKM